MGYLIIDEEKFQDNVNNWNSGSYRNQVFADFYDAVADYSHLLDALQKAEMSIDAEIEKLESKKNNIKSLMGYAK